jgi:orotidine-5'-phosphate decarboxylase
LLTSLGREDLRETGITWTPEEVVTRLARLAHECSLDGVVCSPTDLRPLSGLLPDAFLRVTPGVRPVGAEAGDQRRVATPAEAVANGAHYLVIGRPITQAADPAAALGAIAAEISAT